jgi:O-methyltransferase
MKKFNFKMLAKRIINIILRKFGYKILPSYSLIYRKKLFEKYEVFENLISIANFKSTPGAIVECGFGKGESFVALAYLSKKHRREIYGFDSFLGFPKINPADYSPRNPKVGEWNNISLSDANKMISVLGFKDDEFRCELKQIVFNKTALNPVLNKKIAFLHLDLDLYDGYKYSLEMFWDQISPGGIVVFDEYGQKEWPGATRAINEFLENKNVPRDQILSLKGKHFIIKSTSN